MSPLTRLFASVRDRLVQSRFLTISATVHLIIIALLGTTLYYKMEPPKEKGEITSSQLITVYKLPPEPPKDPVAPVKPFDPSKSLPAAPASPAGSVVDYTPITVIPGSNPVMPVPGSGGSNPPAPPDHVPQPPAPPKPGSELTNADLARIKEGTPWKTSKPGMVPTYEFTAFLGRYKDGNWNSTVRQANGQIVGGSLPNLLYCTSKWSKDRIKTNERNVKAIDLASDELFTVKPPFIFLTGTQDFTLTEKEVENLTKYIRCGGAIWGDSSVPGRRSAFDVAFRREMKRVLSDVDKEFEPLPADHPIFVQGYFKKVTALPSGVNQYREPVEVMKWGGEVAIIHTLNDYGDMWQIGLDKNGQIDLSRNARGEYVAMNSTLWDQRGLYVRNLEQPSVEEAYKFGINMIFHLITRWENRTSSIGSL